MHYLLDWPLYFYSGLIGSWGIICQLPWPNWQEIFKSLVIFALLIRPRMWLDRILNRPIIAKRRPRDGQQSVAASLDDILSHH